MKEEKGGEKQTPSSSAAAPAAPAVSLPPPNQGSAAPSETLAAASPRGTPMVAVPVVAVPCFLAPAGILESPGFTGHFAMTHQALLATVTAQALQASEALKNSFHQPMLSPVLSPISPSPLQQRAPQTFESSVSTPEDLRAQSTQIIVKTGSSDGYNWRKYGQKQVKSSDRSRSYYRCTNSSCLAKKKVERCPDGRETEIIYRGQHNHDPPQKTRSSKERGSQSSGPIVENKNPDVPSDEVNESDPSISKQEQNLGNETPERQLYCSSDCEGDAAVRTEEEHGDESDPKRRLIEYTPSFSEPVLKTIKEPKIVVQSAGDATRASDGYKWRKYGQKFVKGNPNPRSYYRCTHNGCPVRKHVEKASDDAKSILITYEGKHNHQPALGSDQPTASPSDKKTPANGELAGEDDKVSKLGGKNALESAQTLLSIGLNSSSGEEEASGANSNGMNRPLFEENCSVVSVQNS